MKLNIKIKFQNGLEFLSFKKDVFDINGISDDFEFELSDNPDFIIFGPYGIDLPPRGNYIRIGYFCENITPDFNICDWAFGVPKEENFNNPKYTRIQWHGLNPKTLVKNHSENEIDFIINQKKSFCNFLYSNKVPYREFFFKQLSKYKKIDAPGRSMNNMPSIDNYYHGDFWERKRQFLSNYKFTIAFENYSSPGYQTEKIYDPMRSNSLPIYYGDRFINDVFNTNSFINVRDYIPTRHIKISKLLEDYSQPSFKDDCNPLENNSLKQKIKRKIKAIGRSKKMNLEFRKSDCNIIIDEIIRIDCNDDLFANYLREPWLNSNVDIEDFSQKKKWIKIFNSKFL